MLILLTVLILAAAVAILAIKKRRKPIRSEFINNLDASKFRPLFQPTDEELRAFEHEEAKRLETESNLREKWEYENFLSEVERAWITKPSAGNAAEFLRVAAQDSDAATFAGAANKIVTAWRENRTNFTALDLADLLDSHFRLLPQQERTSGEIFELRAQIAELRREVRGK